MDKTVTKEEYENRRSLLFSDSMERDADEINDQVKWLRKNKPPTSSSPNTRSWNLSPDEYKQMNTDILRQDALVTEQSKFNNTHGNKPKDNIINAPTNNVNNSKQNVTNIIDTSKNSFNSANKGLRGSY